MVARSRTSWFDWMFMGDVHGRCCKELGMFPILIGHAVMARNTG